MLSLVLLLACAPQPSPADHAPPPAPLTLEVGPIRPGRVASWTVRGLNPGEDVYIGRGPGLSTHGPCLAAAGGLRVPPRPEAVKD